VVDHDLIEEEHNHEEVPIRVQGTQQPAQA
jgi:hypothetical protein